MTQQHPITPPSELLAYWERELYEEGEDYGVVLEQAYQSGADEQLEQAAKWLDTCALFSAHLTITPSGDALRQAMRPKAPSLKKQALEALTSAPGPDYPIVMTMLNADQHALIRRALEQLDD
jgi:hypothetical protein